MKEKNNYLQGIVGAIIGGLIATIPWILVYVYGKMLFFFLAMLIALGAYRGYTLFKGKITKKTPIIIAIISFALVIIATLVIIPIWLMAKEGVVINIDNFKAVYSNSNFVSAIIRDLVISILFTFLGIGGVISNIKNISLGNVTEKTKEKNKKTIISIIVIAVLVSGIMIWNSLDKKLAHDFLIYITKNQLPDDFSENETRNITLPLINILTNESKDSCFVSGNSLFIQDCFDLYECMFCSHIASKRFCIVNMQFEEQEYYEIKKLIIEWILNS